MKAAGGPPATLIPGTAVVGNPGEDAVKETAFMTVVEESKSTGDVGLVGGVEGVEFQVGQACKFEWWCFGRGSPGEHGKKLKMLRLVRPRRPNLKRHPLYTTNETDVTS